MAQKILKTRFQLRNDIAANWTEKNPVLLLGELGIETDTNKFKIGDGNSTWNALPYAVNNDIELTSDRIKMTKDFVATAQIGVYTPGTSGSVTVPAKDKTLDEFLAGLMAKETNPTITQPSVSCTLSNAGAKEVGTVLEPAYSVGFNKGKYSFGPDTGVTVTAYAVTSTTVTEALTAASGKFPSITVTDTTNYNVTGKVSYSDGVNPKTNIGNDYAAGKIVAGSKSATSAAITGYRNSFYGSVNSKEGEPTSAIIRALAGKKDGAIAAGNTGDAAEAVGAMRVIIAVPSPRTINSIKDVNGLNAEAFSAFTHITVNVEGANSYEAKAYNVYYKDNAGACDKANKWHFTVA